MKQQIPILIFLFILGILFRFWLISLSPQPFVHDQLQYHTYAVGIAENGLFAHTYRTYGYPLLIAAIYKLSGSENIFSWMLFQSMLDTATGFLIFFLAKEVFRSKQTAVVALLLYLFNPFTSAFVGVMLTEITAVFFTTLSFFLLYRVLKTQSFVSIVLCVFTLGYLTQVRPVFFYYSLCILLGLFIWLMKKRNFLIAIISIFVYFVSLLYTIWGNLKIYNQFSLLTVDDFFVEQLYLSLYIDRWPFYADNSSSYPWQVGQIYSEFSFQPQNARQRKEMAKKYIDLSIKEVESKPLYYLIRSFRKIWYIWEKHTLFLYKEIPNRFLVTLFYWVNEVILTVSAITFIYWISKAWKKKPLRLFGITVIFFIFYLSVVHIFTASDERFSLPAYPLIFLFMGYFLYNSVHYLQVHFFPKR